MSSYARPTVAFLIPFASRRMKSRWDVACAHLRQTLKSVQNSTSENYCVVVAGHELAQARTAAQRVEAERAAAQVRAARRDEFLAEHQPQIDRLNDITRRIESDLARRLRRRLDQRKTCSVVGELRPRAWLSHTTWLGLALRSTLFPPVYGVLGPSMRVVLDR